MEIVYRIGADVGQRDQVERTVSSELGSYPEVWCAWSGGGRRKRHYSKTVNMRLPQSR